jgi:hypothetical protein
MASPASSFRGIIVAGHLALLAALFGMTDSPAPSARQEIPHKDAVTGILEVLDSVPLVAIGDIHSVAEQGEFYQRLIRHPRFPDKVDDLILELGNELYQRVADRYVSGQTVPLDSLRMIWENTTQGPLLTATAPMYTSLFDAVREVNAALPPARRVRILLGDPAVEWRTVTRDELWEIHKRRGDRMRELARDSVVAKGRRGIIIAGFRHLIRRPAPDGTDMKWKDLSGKVFVVRPHNGFGGTAARHQAAIDSLPQGSLIRLRDSFIGDLESDEVDLATPPLVIGGHPPSAQLNTRPQIPAGMKSANAGMKMKETADGYLYIAPFTTFTYSAPDVERVRNDPSRLAAIHTMACIMMGRPRDTVALFRVPSKLMYPSGQRPSHLDLEPVNAGAVTMPPVSANLPEPCASLLRARNAR